MKHNVLIFILFTTFSVHALLYVVQYVSNIPTFHALASDVHSTFNTFSHTTSNQLCNTTLQATPCNNRAITASVHKKF